MQVIFGLALLCVAILMIVMGKANADGTPTAFLRGEFAGLMYPVICLAFIAAGAGFAFF
jgi:hypothetical protein